MNALKKIAFVLVIIGALNWGLVGIGGFLGSNWNIVNLILGSMSVIENIVYLLVGLSALLMVFGGKCGTCEVKKETPAPQPEQPTM